MRRAVVRTLGGLMSAGGATASGGQAGTDIIGSGVIVREEDADDYETQPTGSSGARAACGVVRKS